MDHDQPAVCVIGNLLRLSRWSLKKWFHSTINKTEGQGILYTFTVQWLYKPTNVTGPLDLKLYFGTANRKQPHGGILSHRATLNKSSILMGFSIKQNHPACYWGTPHGFETPIAGPPAAWSPPWWSGILGSPVRSPGVFKFFFGGIPFGRMLYLLEHL